MPLVDQFWGDRYGQVTDPFGHVWGLATHKEDLTGEEIGKRAEAWMAQMQPPKPASKKAKPAIKKTPARKATRAAKGKGKRKK